VAYAGRSKKKPAGSHIEGSGDVRREAWSWAKRRRLCLSENAFYRRTRRAAAEILVSPRTLPAPSCPLLSFG
jgi:hypothetical protein